MRLVNFGIGEVRERRACKINKSESQQLTCAFIQQHCIGLDLFFLPQFWIWSWMLNTFEARRYKKNWSSLYWSWSWVEGRSFAVILDWSSSVARQSVVSQFIKLNLSISILPIYNKFSNSALSHTSSYPTEFLEITIELHIFVNFELFEFCHSSVFTRNPADWLRLRGQTCSSTQNIYICICICYMGKNTNRNYL